MKANVMSDTLELRSMYLSQPVMFAHGIALSLKPEEPSGVRKGELLLDPNVCTLDAWGDRRGCTKMAIRHVEVEVVRMRTLDPAGHRRVMHAMRSPEFPDEKASLIEFPDAHLWYVVYLREGGPTFVVPLFPAKLMIPNTGGIISARYGMAIRAAIERGDVEEMRLEADRIREALADFDGPRARMAGVRLDDANVTEVREALAELQDALGELEG